MCTAQELQGFRFERLAEKPQKMKAAKPAAAKASATASKAGSSTTSLKVTPKKKPGVDGGDAAPRVLVERKELQSLQAERRTLFGRMDDAAAEAKELRDTIREREEEINVARVAAAQQHEVWARHDALRCEERDTARAQAEAAEDRARAAGEARAAAENERTRLREQLAVAESEARRAQAESARSIAQLEVVVAERRRTDEEKGETVRDLREELGRERERAAAAEARVREIEPEKEAAHTQLAAVAERLSGALAEAKALESALSQANEMRQQVCPAISRHLPPSPAISRHLPPSPACPIASLLRPAHGARPHERHAAEPHPQCSQAREAGMRLHWSERRGLQASGAYGGVASPACAHLLERRIRPQAHGRPQADGL